MSCGDARRTGGVRAGARAVLGNNDGADVAAWGAPERLEFDLAVVPVAMVPDSGPARGRAARLRTIFPTARLVVFGHSHIPWDETVAQQRAINPGSPTDRRRQPHGTMVELHVEDGAIGAVRFVEVS